MSFIDKIFGTKQTEVKDRTKSANILASVIVGCPYCQAPFSKPPLSKTRCKKCQKFVFVRTHFETHEKQYLTEEQKNYFELESADFYFQKRWLKKFSEMGITINEIEKYRAELLSKWGINPSFHDLAWKIFNSQVVKLGKAGTTPHELKMLFFTWALFACEINSNPKELLRQSHKYELLGYKRTGFIKEVEILSSQGCESCQKLSKKRFKVDDLLKENNVLPNELCTHKLNPKDKYSWCRCMFISVIPGFK